MIDGEEAPARVVARTAAEPAAASPLPYCSGEFADMLERLAQERGRQVAAGNDARHDDALGVGDWMALLVERVGRAGGTPSLAEPTVLQRRLIQVAAVAIAAAEAIERQYQRAAQTVAPADEPRR